MKSYKILFSLLSVSCLYLPIQSENATVKETSGYSRGNGINFIENKGQIIDMGNHLRPDVLYVGGSAGMQVYLRKGGISYVLSKQEEKVGSGQFTIDKQPGAVNNLPEELSIANCQLSTIQLHRIDLDFVGSNSNATVLKSEQIEGYLNYYYPHCPEGITNVHAYNRVVYQNIYPSIDIVFYGGKQHGLKYDIIVRPGGDPNDIKLKYSGEDELRIEDLPAGQAGSELRIIHSLGEMIEQLPKVYQNINGKIVDIKTQYRLEETTVSLQLTTYNLQLPLVIDPWITYYGGGGDDDSRSVTTDNNGDIIYSGSTKSVDFPVTTGAFQTSFHGGPEADVFIVKFNAAGSMLWSTYFGGSSWDYEGGIDADGSNNILLTGITRSTDFPIVDPGGGAYVQNTSPMGGPKYDAFVAKFSSVGTLLWSTYYGGTTGETTASDIVADGADNIIVVGSTYCSNFPITAGAYKTALGGGVDIYVLKFNSASVRQWATYYGGSCQVEEAHGVDCDAVNNIFVCGETDCVDFPVISAHQSSNTNTLREGCLFKLDPTGFPLWSTYYGGSSADDQIHALATDKLGNVFITGRTASANNISTPGSFQPAMVGAVNSFVVKFNNSGIRQWGTYIGTGNMSYGTGLACDVNNNIIAVGDVYFNSFPVTSCAYRTFFSGGESQWVATFDQSGNRICSGYIGTTGISHPETEAGYGGTVAVGGGFLYIAAISAALYPVTPGAYQSTVAGGKDAAFSKLCIYSCGSENMDINYAVSNNVICAGEPVNYSASNNSCDTLYNTYSWIFTGGTPSSSTSRNPSGITYNSAGSYPIKLVVNTPCAIDSFIQNNYITVNAAVAAISGSTVICSGAFTLLTASGGGNYLWSTGTTAAVISVSPTGTTTYTLIATAGICSDTAIHRISVGSIAATIDGSNNVCFGNTAVLTASGGSDYFWSNGATVNSISVMPTATTTYTLIAYSGICSDTVTHTVNIISLPNITLTNNASICNGETLNVTASGGGSYSWSNGLTGANINVNPTSTISYTVTVTDASGCSNDSSITVTVNTIPVADVNSDDTLCIGESLILTASGGAAYNWSNGAITEMITISPIINTVYTVTVSNGNCSDTEAVQIIVYDIPIADAGRDTTIIKGQNVILSASGTGTYYWSTGETTSTITLQPLVTTTYYLTVMDINGCSSIDSVIVTVELQCEELYIPTAFSPNNDGQNDIFQIQGNCIKEIALIIYNRWGEKLFEATDIASAASGWDGRYREKLLEAGVFTYKLTATFVTGEAISKSGNISLIK